MIHISDIERGSTSSIEVVLGVRFGSLVPGIIKNKTIGRLRRALVLLAFVSYDIVSLEPLSFTIMQIEKHRASILTP